MKIKFASNKLMKLVYISLGIIMLGIGAVGILLPIIPGLLFLLLAVYFIAKSSRRLNKLFKKNKYYKLYFEHDGTE